MNKELCMVTITIQATANLIQGHTCASSITAPSAVLMHFRNKDIVQHETLRLIFFSFTTILLLFFINHIYLNLKAVTVIFFDNISVFFIQSYFLYVFIKPRDLIAPPAQKHSRVAISKNFIVTTDFITLLKPEDP